MVRVEHHLPLQQDAGQPEQPIGDATQRAAVGVATPSQGVVAAAALGIVQNGDTSPMEHGLSQSHLGGIAHDDDAGLATVLSG